MLDQWARLPALFTIKCLMRHADHHGTKAAIRILELGLATQGRMAVRAGHTDSSPGRQSGHHLVDLPSRHELLPGHDASRLITSRIDTVTHSLAILIAIWK